MVEGNPVNYNIVPMYINATYEGQDYFVLTAYLVDPGNFYFKILSLCFKMQNKK